MRASLLLAALFALFPAAGCEDGPYASPPGEFPCGATFCAVDSQFCVKTTSDAGTTAASCASLHSACGTGTPGCNCAASECSTPVSCVHNPDGSIILSCSN